MTIFDNTAQKIKENGLTVASFDLERPWGGFFVIEEDQAQLFANVYFDGLNIALLWVSGEIKSESSISKTRRSFIVAIPPPKSRNMEDNQRSSGYY